MTHPQRGPYSGPQRRTPIRGSLVSAVDACHTQTHKIRPTFSFAQVVEAALTTALTDRPYSKPLMAYAGSSFREVPGAAVMEDRGNDGGGGGDYGALEETRAAVLAGEEEDDGLAEVDFRDQYDDFA